MNIFCELDNLRENVHCLAEPHALYHQWFESQVKCTPENIALIDENTSLTYQELNARANQWAHHIQLRCQQYPLLPDSCVAIYLNRTVDMVVAFLAVLKAGGACVPIDSSWPTERIKCRSLDLI